LGKYDHSVLKIHCNLTARKVNNVNKYNYAKADYDSLRNSCEINWIDILCPFDSDIENMWAHFKKEVRDRISQFVPKHKNFNVFTA